jgi:hypothetical protein
MQLSKLHSINEFWYNRRMPNAMDTQVEAQVKRFRKQFTFVDNLLQERLIGTERAAPLEQFLFQAFEEMYEAGWKEGKEIAGNKYRKALRELSKHASPEAMKRVEKYLKDTA